MVFKQFGIRALTDADENAVALDVLTFAVFEVVQNDAVDLLFLGKFGNCAVQAQFDIF